MFIIFLAGMIGFFIFDAYRIRRYFDKTGVVLITFRSKAGIFVHLCVYLACGLLAIVVNYDIVHDWPLFDRPDENIIGPLMRAFGIGVAGPAGLVKNSNDMDAGGKELTDFGSLDNNSIGGIRIKYYLRVLLIR